MNRPAVVAETGGSILATASWVVAKADRLVLVQGFSSRAGWSCCGQGP